MVCRINNIMSLVCHTHVTIITVYVRIGCAYLDELFVIGYPIVVVVTCRVG